MWIEKNSFELINSEYKALNIASRIFETFLEEMNENDKVENFDYDTINEVFQIINIIKEKKIIQKN